MEPPSLELQEEVVLTEQTGFSDWSNTAPTEHRLRLRPWLEGMLDSGSVNGLSWLDHTKSHFKIPWKHRSKKDWDPDHIKVFLEWAKHTGKYVEGDEPDYVAMKTRLRCAFNKAPDIQEVKHLHRLKCSEPYKVYRFINKPDLEQFDREMAKAPPSSTRVCSVPPMVQHADSEVDSDSDEEEQVNVDVSEANTSGSQTSPQRKVSKGGQTNTSTGLMVGENIVSLTLTPTSALDAAQMLLSLNESQASNRENQNILPVSGGLTDGSGQVDLIQDLLRAPPRFPMVTAINGSKIGNPILNGGQLLLARQNAVISNNTRGINTQTSYVENISTDGDQQVEVVSSGAMKLFDPKLQLFGVTFSKNGDVLNPGANIQQAVRGTATPAGNLTQFYLRRNMGKVDLLPVVGGPAPSSVGQSQIVSILQRSYVQNASNVSCVASNAISAIAQHNINEQSHNPARYELKKSSDSRKVRTRKMLKSSGMIFSNQGNIMATGAEIISNIKSAMSLTNPALEEEMMRMRQAYQNPAMMTDSCIMKPIPPTEPEVKVEDPPDLMPITTETVTIYRTAQQGSPVGSKRKDREGEILDLRVSTDSVKFDVIGCLDLSKRNTNIENISAASCLTQEGALDLTLKRKSELGSQIAPKRMVVRKHSSLAVHAIWDLSGSRDNGQESHRQGNETTKQTKTVGVDLRNSPVNMEKEVILQEDKENEDDELSDHTYFSSTLLLPSEDPQGLVVLETTSIAKDEEESNIEDTVSLPMTKVITDDMDSNENGSVQNDEFDVEDTQDDDVDDEYDDNDTKIAAKQLMQLAQGQPAKCNSLPSDDILRAAVKKSPKVTAETRCHSKPENHSWGTEAFKKNNFIMAKDGSRQRLRPWLESQISSGNIQGLEWVDKDNGIFKIPWKHGGKHDWTPDNSRIFMEWAKHTGRFREGIDDADYATWKTRLRCAFNKAPDIVEEKDHSNLTCAEPYRVYRLIPKHEIQRFLTPGSNGSEDEDSSSNLPTGPVLPIVLQEYSAEATSTQHRSSQHPIRQASIILQQFAISPENFVNESVAAEEIVESSVTETTFLNLFDDSQGLEYFAENIPEAGDMSDRQEDNMDVDQLLEQCSSVPDMRIQLKYQGQIQVEKEISGHLGCHVASQTPENPSQAACLLYQRKPPSHNQQENQINSLLQYMTRGILLEAENGNIFATRSCQCGVYFISSTGTNGKPEKLPRNVQKVEIFNMDKYHEAVAQIGETSLPKPTPTVHLVFGQLCDLEHLNKDILITASITSLTSQHS